RRILNPGSRDSARKRSGARPGGSRIARAPLRGRSASRLPYVALSVGIGRRIQRAQRKPIKRNRDAQSGQSMGGGQMVLLLGVVVIAAGIVAVTRRLDVRLALLLMGLALGALAEDVPAVVRMFLATFSNERYVVPICTAMGF